MKDIIMSGQIVDFILIVFGVELLVLGFAARGKQAGLKLGRLISVIVPGLCIFLALRAALVGADWTVIALFLVLSGMAHAFDVWLRWTELSAHDERARSKREAT